MQDRLKELLNDQRKTLKLYALGALLFFIGLGLIQWADQLIEPSIQQEAYALLGTAVGGLGFFTAIFAQILLIINRFQGMGQRRH